MSICPGITQDVAASCDTPLLSGIEDRLILINLHEIASKTLDVSNPLVLTDMSLVTDAEAFAYTGRNHSNEPDYSMERSRYQETFMHQVRFKVFSDAPDIKKELEAMAKVKLVAILQTATGRFEVYGLYQGLRLKELTRNPMDMETGGAFDLLLGSDDNVSKEPHMPATFFDTDFATTKAKVDALLEPAS